MRLVTTLPSLCHNRYRQTRNLCRRTRRIDISSRGTGHVRENRVSGPAETFKYRKPEPRQNVVVVDEA